MTKEDYNFEDYWVDLRSRPYPQTSFRWTDKPKLGRGVEELAKQLGANPEDLTRPGNGPRSVSAWFRTTSGGTAPIVNGVGFSLRIIEGHVVFDRGGRRLASTPTFNDGLWHQVIAVDDRLYVDGAITILMGPPSPTPSDEEGPVLVSNVAFWGRSLSRIDVRRLYNGGQPPDLGGNGPLREGLIGWYR